MLLRPDFTFVESDWIQVTGDQFGQLVNGNFYAYGGLIDEYKNKTLLCRGFDDKIQLTYGIKIGELPTKNKPLFVHKTGRAFLVVSLCSATEYVIFIQWPDEQYNQFISDLKSSVFLGEK